MSSTFDRSLLDYVTGSSVAAVTGTVGLLATALVILLLAERQLLGAAATGAMRRRVRAIEAVVAPLLVLFVAVVVVRFDGLSW
ncbi:MAG: hypothetical protein ACRD12_02240 [Acidimicrobiales bacterium]